MNNEQDNSTDDLAAPDALDALTGEVDHGCLSTRELPNKPMRGAAGFVWFIGSSALIALVLGIFTGVLVKMEIDPRHLLCGVFLAFALGAVVFGALHGSANPRLVRFRPLFVGLFWSYLLGMIGVAIFVKNFTWGP